MTLNLPGQRLQYRKWYLHRAEGASPCWTSYRGACLRRAREMYMNKTDESMRAYLHLRF